MRGANLLEVSHLFFYTYKEIGTQRPGGFMAEPVRPVAKRVYVCDDVIADPSSGKVNLLNLWGAVRVPSDQTFPDRLAKVCVFVWWRDGFGKVRSRVDVVQASTGYLIRRTKDYLVDFEQRTDSVFARYKIENCTFPEPGYYFVEVYCEDEFVDDQVIRIIQE
jgi:hypothetical protein